MASIDNGNRVGLRRRKAASGNGRDTPETHGMESASRHPSHIRRSVIRGELPNDGYGKDNEKPGITRFPVL